MGLCCEFITQQLILVLIRVILLSNLQTIFYTCLALIAFAGNSILCRLALATNASTSSNIDATSFTLLRLFSATLVLALFVAWSSGFKQVKQSIKFSSGLKKHNVLAGIALFVYAAGFSFAYIALETGMGALLLFASVQLTIIGLSLWRGERFVWLEYFGIVIACAGLVYLLGKNGSSTSDSVSIIGVVLMVCAGIAWAVYTKLGQFSSDAIRDTYTNFSIASGLSVILVLIYFVFAPSFSYYGVLLAIASGALASGAGYAIWYLALPQLSSMKASSVQLLVPVIAGYGGFIFASEPITMHLLVSQIVILGGVAIVLTSKQRQQ